MPLPKSAAGGSAETRTEECRSVRREGEVYQKHYYSYGVAIFSGDQGATVHNDQPSREFWPEIPRPTRIVLPHTPDERPRHAPGQLHGTGHRKPGSSCRGEADSAVYSSFLESRVSYHVHPSRNPEPT